MSRRGEDERGDMFEVFHAMYENRIMKCIKNCLERGKG
jgi:hypothetical protein